jgi:dUTP pyrophosphatase
MKLLVKKLNPHAKLPTFAHDSDAGMDLYCVEAITINPGERLGQIKTGIAVSIEEGYVGLIWDKSGISQKHGLKTLGGVVDAGYRGEILVGLINISDTAYSFEVGDKIAQLLIQKVEHPEIIEVESLEDTARGTGGFGSTGTK